MRSGDLEISLLPLHDPHFLIEFEHELAIVGGVCLESFYVGFEDEGGAEGLGSLAAEVVGARRDG